MVGFNKHLKKEPVLTVAQRIRAVAAASAPSMIPVPYEVPAPPPEKEEEIVPPISDLIEDMKVRLELARLVDLQGRINIQLSPLNKDKKKLTDRIKLIVGKFKIGKALSGDWRINYYNAPRSFLDEMKLLAVKPERLVNGITQEIIDECYSKKDSYTLRISPAGSDEEE